MTEKKTVDLKSFIGLKAGMTRVFNENGNHVPVTVVKLIPNVISQVKTEGKDGYQSYQVGYYEKREKLLSNPVKGKLKKANIEKFLANFTEIKASGVSEDNLGAELSYGEFSAGDYIDVSGKTKGKGFQGVIKRHGFQGGPAAHGSKFHRTTGSIGNRATPGRVFAQKKMPGHMGDVQNKVQNLKIVEINEEKGYLLIKGSVPGSKNSFIKISKAIKK